MNSADATIDVSMLGYDRWGHINTKGVQKYKLGDFFQDSTRPIKVKDEVILIGTEDERKYPVNYKADEEWLTVTADNAHSENATITYSHKQIHTAIQKVEANKDVADKTLYFGSKFKIPTLTFDKAGHYTTSGYEEFSLSSEAIKHDHFDIVEDGNALKIKAYEIGQIDYTALKAGAFYHATANQMNNQTINPNYLMGFKGSLEAYALYQQGEKVLDSSFTISSGNDFNGNTITGTYSADGKTYTLGESGIIPSDAEEPVTYSAVAFNKQGIGVAGGYVLQFGSETNNVPSQRLVVGGLFFRRRTSLVSTSTTPTTSLEEAALI